MNIPKSALHHEGIWASRCLLVSVTVCTNSAYQTADDSTAAAKRQATNRFLALSVVTASLAVPPCNQYVPALFKYQDLLSIATNLELRFLTKFSAVVAFGIVLPGEFSQIDSLSTTRLEAELTGYGVIAELIPAIPESESSTYCSRLGGLRLRSYWRSNSQEGFGTVSTMRLSGAAERR